MGKFLRVRGKKRTKRTKGGIMSIPRSIRPLKIKQFSTDKFAVKCKFRHNVVIDHVTTGAFLYEYSLRDPTNCAYRFALSAPGWTAQNDSFAAVAYSNEFKMYAALFDLVRVMAVKWVYTPANTVNDFINAQANTPLYTWADFDNIYSVLPNITTPVNTTATAPFFLGYNNIKEYQIISQNQLKRYLKVPKVSSGAPNDLAYNSLNFVDSQGYYNTSHPIANSVLYMFMNQTGATKEAIDTLMGYVDLTYYCVFKRRV